MYSTLQLKGFPKCPMFSQPKVASRLENVIACPSTRSRGWLHLCGFCIMNHFDVLVLHAYSVHLILGTNVVFFPHRTFLFYHSILTSRTFPGQQQHQHSISVFQSTVAMHSVPCCSLILLPSTTELLVRKWQEGQSATSVVLAIAQEHSARMSRSSLEVCLLSLAVGREG